MFLNSYRRDSEISLERDELAASSLNASVQRKNATSVLGTMTPEAFLKLLKFNLFNFNLLSV